MKIKIKEFSFFNNYIGICNLKLEQNKKFLSNGPANKFSVPYKEDYRVLDSLENIEKKPVNTEYLTQRTSKISDTYTKETKFSVC